MTLDEIKGGLKNTTRKTWYRDNDYLHIAGELYGHDKVMYLTRALADRFIDNKTTDAYVLLNQTWSEARTVAEKLKNITPVSIISTVDESLYLYNENIGMEPFEAYTSSRFIDPRGNQYYGTGTGGDPVIIFVGFNCKSLTMDPTVPQEYRRYFQKQEGLGCARHALNNLFQRTVFKKGNLSDKNDVMIWPPPNDNREISLMAICKNINLFLTTGGAAEQCQGAENHDVNTVVAALDYLGYASVQANRHFDLDESNTVPYFGLLINLGLVKGLPKHWISARFLRYNDKGQAEYVIYNSQESPPSVCTLRGYLEDAERRWNVSFKQGVFVVKVLLPRGQPRQPKDRLSEMLTAAVGGPSGPTVAIGQGRTAFTPVVRVLPAPTPTTTGPTATAVNAARKTPIDLTTPDTIIDLTTPTRTKLIDLTTPDIIDLTADVPKVLSLKKKPGPKSAPKKSPAKKSPAKKSPAKKSPAKKSPAKKRSPSKKPAKKSPAKRKSKSRTSSKKRSQTKRRSPKKKQSRRRKSANRKRPARKGKAKSRR